MRLLKNTTTNHKLTSSSSSSSSKCSISSLFLTICLLLTLSITLFILLTPTPQSNSLPIPKMTLKVFVFELPRSLNYGLLDQYWSSKPDSRIPNDPDHESGTTHLPKTLAFGGYPENPLIKQYSAEYWILGDLMTDEELRTGSVAKRVFDVREADVVFVPFFATLSAEMQLGLDRGMFRKKVPGNGDYVRQREVVDLVMKSEAWMRSGGRDHVFVLTDPVAMWHVKNEIAPAVLLVVDFGGWQRLDSKSSNGTSPERIQHTQVSLLKDVIVPYTHLLPRLDLSENKARPTLLYFKGAKHRNGGGMIREKLWDLLVDEPGVIMEEGFPNATGKEQSMKGMRTSQFCLHPAGDTPTSCRLFDAIQSLCIPVIISDHIELPFEGMIDYLGFSVFVSVNDALQPKWLANHLRSFLENQKEEYRRKMARVQHVFQYDNGHPGGIGPVLSDGAVNHIWMKVHQKLPMIKESILRDRRKPPGVSIPLRCQCT
ncbi:hypothetical protein Drorol1_Dr00000761 [Drosera rotundifolia]